MLGTFSGGGLGMGVAFRLEDYFSKTADTIERRMGQLGGYTDVMATKIDRAMDKIKLGAGMAAIGAAVLTPFVKGLKASSDYEENINKLEVAFGNYADKVRNFTDNVAFEKIGLGKNKASEYASLFGDLSTGMKFAQKEAADLSIELTTIAGDIASFKNLQGERAKNVLKGIFTGESEALKGIGVVMTKDNINEYLKDKGKGKFDDLSQLDKVRTRFEFVREALKNSAGDFERTGTSYANMKRKMDEATNDLLIVLGDILNPIASKLFGVVASLFKVVERFAKTKAGKVILGIVAALGAFLVVSGLTLMSVSGLRFAIYKMAGAFGNATKEIIITTIATKGARAGFKAMGVAAWASLGPFLLVVAAIAAVSAAIYYGIKMMKSGEERTMRWGAVLLGILGPIGWVIAGITGISVGLKKFDKWDGKQATGGIIGFFMKIAGVLKAVKQIWNSFNGETFTLTKSLSDKLKALGLLDFVLKLGTWIARLKTIWNGVVLGFKMGLQVLSARFGKIRERLSASFGRIWKVISRTFGKIKKAFQPLIDLFHRLTNGIFKNNGSLVTWKKVADFVTNSIVLGFEFVATVIEWIVTAVSFAIETFVLFIEAVVDAFIAVWDFASKIYDVGVNFMQNLWDGFKAMFPNIAEWLENAVAKVFAKIKAPFKWLAEKTGQAWDWVTGSGDDDGVTTDDAGNPTNPTDVPTPNNTHPTNTSKSPKIIRQVEKTNEFGGQTIVLQTVLDGEVISEKVVDNLEMKNARGND